MSLRYAPAVFAPDHLPFVRPPVIDAAPRPARAAAALDGYPDAASAADPDADASPEAIQAQWRAAWAAAGARLAEASPDHAAAADGYASTYDALYAAPDPAPDPNPADDPIAARRARLWGAVRADYLAGEPAAVVAERHGVSLSALRTRARQEGWRRADLPEPMWPEPERRPQEAPYDPHAPLPDPRALAEDALRRAAHAQAHDRPLEAARWLRLAHGHLRLAALSAKAAAADTAERTRQADAAHAECMRLLHRRARRDGAPPPLSLDDHLAPHEAAAALDDAGAAGASTPPPGALRLRALLSLLHDLRRATAAEARIRAAQTAPSAPSAPSAPPAPTFAGGNADSPRAPLSLDGRGVRG